LADEINFTAAEEGGIAQPLSRLLRDFATVSWNEWKKLQRLPVGAIAVSGGACL
jgi:hypothetical protein